MCLSQSMSFKQRGYNFRAWKVFLKVSGSEYFTWKRKPTSCTVAAIQLHSMLPDVPSSCLWLGASSCLPKASCPDLNPHMEIAAAYSCLDYHQRPGLKDASTQWRNGSSLWFLHWMVLGKSNFLRQEVLFSHSQV